PKVPRACMPRLFVQRKGWKIRSPARLDWPTTSPRLFRAAAEPNVPPSVPRSSMVPFLPEERILGREPGNRIWGCVRIGYTCDLTTLVNQGCERIVPGTQTAQILHRSVLPEKRSGLRCAEARGKQAKGIRNRVQGSASHLAAVVDGTREALVSTLQRSTIGDTA